MAINIRDSISAATAGLTAVPQQAAGLPAGGGEMFAGHLEQALKTARQGDIPSQTDHRTIAETLQLGMLRTALSLGEGNTAGDMPAAGRQLSQIHSLLRSYLENTPESSSGPSPAPAAQSQQNDAAATVRAGHPAPAQDKTPAALDSIIRKASDSYGVDEGLIRAVIKAESGFNPTAVSPVGARGLMQLMPGTARSLGVSDSFDPEQNIMAGTRFLRDLLKRYNGNLDSALAAYNWGPGNVDRRPDSLPKETREYLVRVKQYYQSYTA